jgi:effector-binding domain-containing protein
LKPAEIDDFTGYRYYREEQLFTIGRITSLKDMGFALADIIKILESYDDKEKMDAFLSEKQKELSKLSQETEYKLMLLETARKRLRKEQKMSFDVTVKTIPERYAATVHMVVPHYEDEGMAWNMMGECKEPLIPADPCYAIAEFLDDEFKEEDVEIVVSMAVKGKYQDTEHVKFKTLPAIKVASCVIKGCYDQMGEAYATAASWIKANGHKMNGPMFNIYHVSPAQTKNPEEYVTEACFPIE